MMREHRRRPTMFAPAAPTLAEQLRTVPDQVERLYLAGRPGGRGHDAVTGYLVDGGALPAGCSHGSHVVDQRAPVFKVERAGRRPLWIMRATTWGGDDATPAELHADAHAEARTVLRAVWDAGAQLLATPAATGRELILRSLPIGSEWPTLPADVQQLIRSTSGQGRNEGWWSRQAEPLPPAQLDQLVEVDQRLSYVALCRELPAGELTRGAPAAFDPYARARYLVRFHVPHNWRHVGLLPVLDDAGAGRRGGWRWPNDPGSTGRGWCDGAELLIAQRAGWSFAIDDALVWPRYTHAGPLDRWAQLVVRAVEHVEQRRQQGITAPDVAQLAGRYLRSVALHAIGSLHGRQRVVTRVVDEHQADDVPADALFVRVERGQVIYGMPGGQAAPELAHPEWSAAVWARARSRLLRNPAGGGALDLAPEQVVAFRTDAIWTTTSPAWADGAKVGSYRVKTVRRGPLPRPASVGELLNGA